MLKGNGTVKPGDEKPRGEKSCLQIQEGLPTRSSNSPQCGLKGFPTAKAVEMEWATLMGGELPVLGGVQVGVR